MGILQLPTPLVGQGGLKPASKKMLSSDDLATITSAGYLNNVSLEGYAIEQSDHVEMLYNYNTTTGIGTYAEFTALIVNGVITLVEVVPPGGVTVIGTPTAGHIAIFASPNSIQDGGVLGQAAAKAVSNNTLPSVSSVSGATVVGHVATFADAAGTIQDGGALGTAAAKAASDNTKPSVASVSGATVANNILTAADTAGTVKDSGVAISSLQPSANIKAAIVSTGIGGSGVGPYTVTVAGLTGSSIVHAQLNEVGTPATTTSAVHFIEASLDEFNITFTLDPGPGSSIQYIAFISPQ
jgi:hypothetical protein